MGPSGASSDGYEEKRTDWSNTGDRGNDYVTKGDTDKNKDKDDASRTGKEQESEEGKEKEIETERAKKKEETGPGKKSSMLQKKICGCSRQQEKQLELHVQEQFGSEQ